MLAGEWWGSVADWAEMVFWAQSTFLIERLGQYYRLPGGVSEVKTVEFVPFSTRFGV